MKSVTESHVAVPSAATGGRPPHPGAMRDSAPKIASDQKCCCALEGDTVRRRSGLPLASLSPTSDAFIDSLINWTERAATAKEARRNSWRRCPRVRSVEHTQNLSVHPCVCTCGARVCARARERHTQRTIQLIGLN